MDRRVVDVDGTDICAGAGWAITGRSGGGCEKFDGGIDDDVGLVMFGGWWVVVVDGGCDDGALSWLSD